VFCNGASLSTTTYANLFAVCGYTYGGSGANFNVPNLKSSAPFGSDITTAMGLTLSNGNVNATFITGGNKTMTSNQIAQHSHSITFGNASFVSDTNNANNTTVGGFDARLVSKSTTAFPAGTNDQTYSTSGQQDYLPPFCAVQYIIKT